MSDENERRPDRTKVEAAEAHRAGSQEDSTPSPPELARSLDVRLLVWTVDPAAELTRHHRVRTRCCACGQRTAWAVVDLDELACAACRHRESRWGLEARVLADAAAVDRLHAVPEVAG